MLACTYEEARAHLQIVLGIDLENHLEFRNKNQLKFYALLGTLVVIYRYAEALGQHMRIFDMSTGGHKSHLVGTELDFDYAPDAHDPVNQINVASDMLRVREAVESEMDAFRIGIYFDHFENTDVRTFEEYRATYGRNRNKSMHLGVRYKFQSADYQGERPPAGYGLFSFWGKGSRTYGNHALWARRILSWNIGFIRERAVLVGATVLKDLAALDQSPPTMVVLGAGTGTGPLPRVR